ncbi:MAG: hypothetical protein CL608_20805 [Anaerolineaceae bacterium]|nr:hypothetical protein [Anaerolineaceae bacterium]
MYKLLLSLLVQLVRRFPTKGKVPVLLLLGIIFAVTAVSPVLSVPVIVAIKSDTLTVDIDADNFADPGDTIRYTNFVTNTGTVDAGAVIFDDTIDGNTTFVAGSLRTTPIARHDQYASLGNVGITVPAASGALANDNDPDGQTVSVIAAAGGTANGGAYSMGADGSFSYLPPTGFEGTDQFTYSIQDPDSNIDLATVFIVVAEMIWFIDNSAGAPGGGGLTTPLNSIAAFNAKQTGTAPGAKDGDIVFLHSGSGSYISGILLRNNQLLVGQGATASLASIAGLTLPPHSNALPATGGTRPTITTTSGDGVVVAQNNLLRGFNVGNTAGVGISDNGGTVGALTVSEMAIFGTGGGFEADNGGTLAVLLDGLSANSSSEEGIDLENVAGSFSATATNNTLNMTGVPAVVIDGNPTLALNLNFQSVGSTNAAHGISIRDTTGSFAVAGTGAANSGGTLSGHSAEGVFLNNALNISLTDMVINQSATSNTQGIDATSITGLTLVRTTITAGTGNSYALLGSTIRNWTATSSVFDGGGGSVANIDGTRITNLLGTNTLTNSTFRNGKDINLLIENNINGGGLDSITISGSSFSNSAGGDHLQVEADGTANLKLVVNASTEGNTTFSGTGQDGMQLEAEGNATFQAVVTGATISGNLGSAVNIAAVVNGHMIARVHGLTGLSSGGTNVINMINFDNSLIEATVENNSITSATAGNGIRVIQEGNGTITANLVNNNIQGVTQGSGILVQGRAGTGGNGRINATINNNFVRTTSSLSLDGIEVTSGSSAGGDTNTVCLNMLNNDSSSDAFDGYFLRHRTGSTFQLQDFAGPATSAGITTWVNTTKSNTGSVFVSGASNFTAAPSTCATPTVPTAAVPASTSVVDAAEAAPQMTLNMTPIEQLAAKTAVKEFVVTETGKEMAVAKPAFSGETINVLLGTLNPGQTVIITFDITIDNPQSPVTNGQVCNQGLVSGNNFTNVLTDDPAVGGSIDPTCTLLAPGTIIITKDQSPDGSSSFGFSSTIPGNATFNVSGGSSVTINNVTPGSYTVTEDDPSAGFFALTGLDCDDDAGAAPSTTDLGTRTATVNLESGETVTCTFTNEQIGRLEVIKSVDATPNGETFDLLIDGNVEASGVGNGGTTGEIGVTTGNHSVSETGTNLGNYNSNIECVLDGTSTVVASGSGTSLANIPVNAGDDVLCTITNTHKTGSLEVVKNLEPASDSGSFDMRIDTTAHVATGGDGTTTGEQIVPIGTHLVSETGDGPTNLFDYTVSISCKDNNGTGSEVTATPNGAFGWDVTVNEGDDIVCIVTNQRNGTINIVKEATPANDTVFSFNHDVNGGGSFTLQDPSDDMETVANVTPGSYTVSEVSLPSGWSLTDIACTEDQAANSTEDEANAQALITLDPGETVTCTFTNVFNQPPVANDDSYTATEDTMLNVAAPGVLDNDIDADGDSLTAVLDSTTGNGTLTLNGDGSFSYESDENFCGPDSFTYHASDGQADSNVATVNITVECVDDPPVVNVDVTTQSVQYSDSISTVTVIASDIDSHPLSISDNAPSNLSTSGGCTAGGGGTSCTWTLTGQVLVAAGTYNVTFTVSDATTGVTSNTEIVVTAEDADVSFDVNNPTAVEVGSPGGSGSFTLVVFVQESSESGGGVLPGDINEADVSVTLEPIGPGSPITVSCTATGAVTAFDYTAVLEVSCDLSGVPVNAYTAIATVAGGYYTGSTEDAIAVYDPSLGFTTGGGSFFWPGTNDRTTFAYTMSYKKNGSGLKGNLVLIRHMEGSNEIYRLKSNALGSLSLGEGDNGNTFGWAVFSGKATYQAPGMAEPEGNYTFTVYVEDHGEPGKDNDRFWLEVRDKNGNVVSDLSLSPEAADNAVTLSGGNIVVPHDNNGGGGGGRKK